MNPQDQNDSPVTQNQNPEQAAQPSQVTPLSPGQDIQPSSSMTPSQPPAQTVVSQPQKGGGFKKVLIAVLVLILLGGAGFGVYTLTKSDKNTSNKSAVSQKQDVQQITLGVIGGTIAFYPKSTTDSYAQAVSEQIFEGLVAYQDETKIVPVLATGWSNPDSSTWDFNIRKNVLFHNGHSLTAADVVASLEMAKNNSDLSIYNDTLGDVKALSDYKVQIKTTKPDPFLLNKLTYLKILDSKALTVDDTTNATGPYQIKTGTTPTDKDLELSAFNKYHGGHVYVKALNYHLEPDEATAITDFKAGKVNMIGEYSAAQPEELKASDAQKIIVNDPSVTFVTLNMAPAGPLQNVKVRQALKLAIDIPSVISAANISAEPASQLVTQAIPGYNPSISVAKQDKTKAKQLLAEAGYPNGVTLNIEVSTQNQLVAQELVKEAKDVGITLNLTLNPDFDSVVDHLLSGTSQMTVLAYSSDLQDGSEVFDTVLRQTGNYKSAALDKYLDQASSTLDQAKRLQYLQEASKTVDDDVAAIPLFSRQRTWFMDKPYVIQVDNLSSDPGFNFWKVYLSK